LPVLEMGGWWTRSVVAGANDAKCRERTPDRLRAPLLNQLAFQPATLRYRRLRDGGCFVSDN
jgi:hypothetical protein